MTGSYNNRKVQPMMKKNEHSSTCCIPLLITVLTCGILAHAQGFSADLVDASVHAMPPQHIPVRVQGDKMRMEMTDLESPGSSAILLIDFAQHWAVVALPEQHVYIDATTVRFGRKIDWQLFRPQSADDACSTWTKTPAQKTSIECKKVGPETVDGRAAYKYQVSGLGGAGEGFVWIDQNLRVLLKMDAEGTHLVMRDLQEGPQGASLFEIPAGYQKVNFAGMGLDSHQR